MTGRRRIRCKQLLDYLNRLTPNDPYIGRTAPLTSKRCTLYTYSTSIGTEYFKHALYSPFFSLQNAVCFIMLTCLVSVFFTFYMQGVLKLKKINSGAKVLMKYSLFWDVTRRRMSYITDVLGKPIGTVFRGKSGQEESL